MHSSTLQDFLGHLRRLTDPNRSLELSDADLLERFRTHQEEAAFTLLVQRHGPMVLAVCRRILGDVHGIEDVFQATFLVLIRKEGTIRKQASLAAWLHRTAARLALKARAQAARRQHYEREVPPQFEDRSDRLADGELRAALEEEIERLPDKYRMPLVLCYLTDKTHEQAACQLGCPKSSITSRLARARELLKQRLIRRGFTAPAGLLAVLLTEATTNAALPAVLTLSTVRLAVRALTGQTLAASATVALADGFAKGSAVMKWTVTLTLLTALGFTAAVGPRMASTGSPQKQAEPPPKARSLNKPQEAKVEPPKPRLDWQGDPLPDEALARMGSGRMRQAGLSNMAYSSDGKWIATATKTALRIWDATTGKLVRRFDVDTDWCLTFAFTREGVAVANAGLEKGIVTVRIVDPASGKVRRRVETKERATAANLIFSPDGKRLAYTHDNSVRLFDPTTGAETLRIPVKGIVAWEIAFAPDGKTLAFTDLTDTIHLHNAADGKEVRQLKRAGEQAMHLRFSPDGRFLVSLPENKAAKEKGEVSVWNLADGKERYRWTHPFRFAMNAAFSPDGKTIAITGAYSELVLRDLSSGKEIRRLSAHERIHAVAFSTHGKTLATASPWGVIRQWEVGSGRLLPASADLFVHDVHDLRFSTDGKRLLGCSAACIAWNADNGEELHRVTCDAPNKIDYVPLVLSPDESRAAVAVRDGEVRLYDAVKREETQRLKGGDRFLSRLAFTPDSRWLITSGDEKKLRVWDVAGGRELRKWSERGGYTACMAISPDGRWLATAPVLYEVNKYVITLWDLATGAEKRRFFMSRNFPNALAFSRDGLYLAAVGGGGDGNRGEIRVWNVQDGRESRSLEGRFGSVNSVAFSPDGRMLATGCLDGLLLWELAGGRRRHRFFGQEGGISSLAFSPKGRRLAASSVDAPVFVWDVAGTLEPKPRRLSKDELQRAWTSLAAADAAAAFQTIRRLAAVPEQTLPLLREHLKAVAAPDFKRVRQLVRELDSDDFATRQRATEELEHHADAAASLLREILAKEKPTLEVRKRLQQILANLDDNLEALRAVRAVEVVEWIGSPDAMRLLDEWAKGAEGARLTREALAAKRRLAR